MSRIKFNAEAYRNILHQKGFIERATLLRESFDEPFVLEKKLLKRFAKATGEEVETSHRHFNEFEKVGILFPLTEPEFEAVEKEKDEEQEILAKTKDLLLDIRIPVKKYKQLKKAKKDYCKIVGIKTEKKKYYYRPEHAHKIIREILQSYKVIFDSKNFKEIQISENTINHFFYKNLLPVLKTLEFAKKMKYKQELVVHEAIYEKKLGESFPKTKKIQKLFNNSYKELGLGIITKEFIEEYINNIFDFLITAEKVMNEMKIVSKE